MQRLSGLDELRGVAVGLVLVLHLAVQLGDGGFMSELLLVPALGVGVDLFFVISGVVIVQSLFGFREKGLQASETVSAFYTRRFMRIVPFAWFVALLAGLSIIVRGGATVGDIATALSFTGNVYWAPCFGGASGCGNPDITGHYWSLATEMQFYLVAPLLLFAGRRAVQIAVIALLVVGVFWARPWGGYWWTFRVEALAIGILIGMEIRAGNAVFKGNAGAMTVGEAALWMVLAGVVVRLLQGIAPGLAIVIVAVTAGAIVGRSVKRPAGWSRSLTSRTAAWLGRNSYGIYLVHPLVIAIVGFTLRPDFGFAVCAAIAAPLSVLVGWYLGRAVEKPARDLGYWLTRDRSEKTPQ